MPAKKKPHVPPPVIDTPRARLDVALAARGLTFAGLAGALNVRREAISRLVTHGVEVAGRVTWTGIAGYLGVPVEALRVGGPIGPLVGLPDEIAE